MAGLISQITKAASRLVLETPKSFGEALWRFLSLSTVTGVLVSAVLLWRYPRIVQTLALGGEVEEQVIEDIFRRRPKVKAEAMRLIGQYVARWQPSQIAIVNWTTQTGIAEVWANESTKGWPTSTNGIMSRNMKDVVGDLIFDQCWTGPFERAVGGGISAVPLTDWAVCGMSDSFDIWGYLLVHWDGQNPPEGAVHELELLARHLERLLFE